LSYKPEPLPLDIEGMTPALRELWERDAEDLHQAQFHSQDRALFTKFAAPPAKPEKGGLYYADGSTWNPGQGEGLYFYDDLGRFVPIGNIVDIRRFGAIGDGITDDTVAINRFFAAVAAGLSGKISNGIYKFTAALTPLVGNNITIFGDGDGSILQYAGASVTPGDLITIGDGSATYFGLKLSGFTIGSNINLTAGFGLRVRKIYYSNIDVNINGSIASSGKLFGGLWLDGCFYQNLATTRIFSTSKQLLCTNCLETHCGDVDIRAVSNVGTIGIHLAGGNGAFYAERARQQAANLGMLIDNSVVASANIQIFLDQGATFDSNTTAALQINDTLGASSISKIIRADAWFASSIAGSGILVSAWPGGKITSSGGIFINNNVGINSADTSARLVLGSGVQVNNNLSFGLNATAPWSVISDAQMVGNITANFSPNVSPTGMHYGTLQVAQPAATGWGIDFAQTPSNVIAVAGSITLATGSGLVTVHNDSTGLFALFIVYAGNVIKIAGDGSIVSGAPAASQVGLQFTAGVYKLTNGYASAQSVYVGLIRTRPSN
jgi:hypothetical protein